MPLPTLTVGLVVRYEYLWNRRRVTGAGGADKDHPACVVMTFQRDGRPEDFVVYLPISHTPPGPGEIGVALPDDVKTKAGLDRGPQWILISECNIDAWPYDLRPLPRQPGMFHYGHMPPSFFNRIRDEFVALYRDKKVSKVGRASA